MIDLSPQAIFLLLTISLAASWVGVALFRRWTISRELLDVPNDRSSHSVPTPRGGGLIIAVVCLAGYAAITTLFNTPFSWGYVAGAILIAGVSWLDDLYSLPVWSRLIVQIAGACVLIADVSFWHEFAVPLTTATVRLGDGVGIVLTVGWIVWLVNAYNFMDGIDGIAALQAAIAGVGWAVLAFILGFHGVFLFAGLVAAASLGFLVHNWQPAKIFMGDVGSAFLGFTLAALPLLAQFEARTEIPLLPIAGVLAVWFFVFDTLVTLIRRLIARKKVWEAHREHIYQRMIIAGLEHSTVTLIYGALAAFLCASLVLHLVFAGIFTWLALFALIIPTLVIGYFGIREKH